jgi:hypothetical protein
MTDALIILRRFGDTVKHHRQRLGVSQEEFGFRGNMQGTTQATSSAPSVCPCWK